MKKRMHASEAAEILNLKEAEAKDASVVEASFKRIFEANDPKHGGSCVFCFTEG